MNKFFKFCLLMILGFSLVSCVGEKPQKERVDYKNEIMETLIEKAGMKSQTTKTLETNTVTFWNDSFFYISRNMGYSESSACLRESDLYINSDTKMEQYYIYTLQLIYKDSDFDKNYIVMQYKWIDSSYQGTTTPDINKIAVLNNSTVCANKFGGSKNDSVSLASLNVNRMFVNYTGGSYETEEFTYVKASEEEDVDMIRVIPFQSYAKSMIENFEKYLTNNLIEKLF